MIIVSGSILSPVQTEAVGWGSLGQSIVETLSSHQTVYRYPTFSSLQFEVRMRLAIIEAARALSQSGVSFAVFSRSRCNEAFWDLTPEGGFRLRTDVSPSSAIRNIFESGKDYAFECATAIIIIYYKAVLDMAGSSTFDSLFPKLYLYDGQYDPKLALETRRTNEFVPGDEVYFKNPDVSPSHPEWQGENAIDLGDGTYYGHGVGVGNQEFMIAKLNRQRFPGATRSAYLLDQATNPGYRSLEKLLASSPSPFHPLQLPLVSQP